MEFMASAPSNVSVSQFLTILYQFTTILQLPDGPGSPSLLWEDLGLVAKGQHKGCHHGLLGVLVPAWLTESLFPN